MQAQARAGVPGLSDLLWGTHCCHFFSTPDDLLHALVPYFKAGLDGNETCLWVASEPLRAVDARRALAAVTPDLADREAKGQIEILDYDAWYLRVNELAAEPLVQLWVDREQNALSRGYSGLRVSGNLSWLQRDQWKQLVEYERLANDVFRNHRILALCSYCLEQCSAAEVVDVVANHHYLATRADHSWHIAEGSLLQTARQEIVRMQQTIETLASADRRKDQFIALLGHELRNPLSPIGTAVELMRLRGAQRDVRELDIIDRQLQHLNTLVDDMLDLSRIVRGVLRMNTKLTALRDVVARAIEVVTPHIQRRQHELRVHEDAADSKIEADVERLVQAFSNVLTNAAKYTPPGGAIAVTTSREATHATVTIRDNGPGIPADVLPYVFEPFVQAERAISQRDGGLGLGLPIVKSVIELHHGTVNLTSTGDGTCVSIQLPVAAADEVSEKLTTRSTPTAGESRRLLLVDDNEDTAVLLSEALEQLGYKVRIAANGIEALEVAELWLPEIAILDIGLPGIDGYELARRIRSIPALQRIRLIALTGYGTPDDLRRAQQAGFDFHATKPIRVATLGAMLRD